MVNVPYRPSGALADVVAVPRYLFHTNSLRIAGLLVKAIHGAGIVTYSQIERRAGASGLRSV